MKQKLAVAVLALALVAVAIPASANRYRRGQSDNPMRLVAYVLHPVGLALEYGIMRPIHWVVSQPDLDIVFGHQARPDDEGTYFEWTHGDFTPSIKSERMAMEGSQPTTRPTTRPANSE